MALPPSITRSAASLVHVCPVVPAVPFQWRHRQQHSGRRTLTHAGPPANSGLVPGQVINKIPTAMNMTAEVYSYIISHTREHEVLRALREETSGMRGYQMQITPEQGALLAMLVEVTGAKRVIEVGVFTGYSSLSMALALPADGRLVALDRDEATMAVARRFFERGGVAGKVEPIVAPGLDSLGMLLQRDGSGSYDMAFIDADKKGYPAYFEALLKLMRPGGLICVDNVLYHGRVADPMTTDVNAKAIHAFNEQLLRDERVSVSIVPIGDGMTLCRKR